MTEIASGSLADKILGMFFGHALGDAVGLITEFKIKKDKTPIEFPYKTPIRGFPVCDWTDDTDHLLIVMVSMIRNNFVLVPQDIAHGLVDWMRKGIPELGDTVGLGLGGTTNMVLTHSDFLTDPMKSAREIWQSSGGRLAPNGSLMRTSVVGCLPNVIICEKWAASLSKVTHADPRCIASCVLHSLLVRSMLFDDINAQNIDNMLYSAIERARAYLLDSNKSVAEAESIVSAQELRHQPTPMIYKDSKFKSFDEEFAFWIKTAYTGNLSDLKLDDLGKIGFVLKCLGCSIYTLHVIKVALQVNRKPSFKKLITGIAEEAGDADTNCAVAGALLGAHLGYSQLPADWINALPHGKWLHKQVITFINALFDKLSGAQQQSRESERQHIQSDASERRQMQSDASELRQMQSDASERRQMQADASERRQMQADASERRQMQADASENQQTQSDTSEHRQMQADSSEHQQTQADASEQKQTESLI